MTLPVGKHVARANYDPSVGKVMRHGRRRNLCLQCERGDHSRRHGKIGCIREVDKPPADFVCRCEVIPEDKP